MQIAPPSQLVGGDSWALQACIAKGPSWQLLTKLSHNYMTLLDTDLLIGAYTMTRLRIKRISIALHVRTRVRLSYLASRGYGPRKRGKVSAEAFPSYSVGSFSFISGSGRSLYERSG